MKSHFVSPRRALVAFSVLLVAVLLVSLLASCAPAPAAPAVSMKVTSPAAGATVTGPKVKVEVDVQGLTLVDANIAPKDGEGHIHFFIDSPASSVAVGQVIPTDQATKYVHAGKAPYTNRELDLTAGQHTITIVAANAAHQALAVPAPVSVSFTVK